MGDYRFHRRFTVDDTAPSIDFIIHALDALADAGDHYDYLVLLEPTSPLTEASDVDASLETLAARRGVADKRLRRDFRKRNQ